MLIDEKSIQIVKSDIISEIEKRVEDKILEPSNADLLKKLINNAETTTEAIEIAKLGISIKGQVSILILSVKNWIIQ